MAVSKRKRFEVFKRDLFCCQYCGRKPPAVLLECDHVVPSSRGGTSDYENLITSCVDCNRGKSNVPLESMPAKTEIEQFELIAQLTAFNEMLIESRAQRDAQFEYLLAYISDAFNYDPKWLVNSADARTLKVFFAALSIDSICDAADRTASKFRVTRDTHLKAHGWRYFCGICWRRIKERGDGEGT